MPSLSKKSIVGNPLTPYFCASSGNWSVSTFTFTKSFDKENAQSKAIIIITDGENHDEEAIESAKKAREEGIYIQYLYSILKYGYY